MKKITFKNLLLASGVIAILSLGACSDDNKGKGNESSTLNTDIQSAIDGPKSTMTQTLKNTLSFMGNEERLAYDIYNILFSIYPDVKQLNNIPKSEFKHISAVQGLVQKYIQSDADFTNVDLPALEYKDTAIAQMRAGVYDIKSIQDLYDALYAKGVKSERDALEVGCMVEVTDINDLEEKIAIAKQSNAGDVETVFNFLIEGSYNHYWAFDKGLKSRGVSAGCCALGVIDGVDYCHLEYPKK